MRTEFRRSVLPKELGRLLAFDHKVFPKSDWFAKSDWGNYESYWMIVDGVAIGCCAFQHHVDFQDDPNKVNPPRRGSLFIATTGILPERRSAGTKCVSRERPASILPLGNFRCAIPRLQRRRCQLWSRSVRHRRFAFSIHSVQK
jgi:hypothetical protein